MSTGSKTVTKTQSKKFFAAKNRKPAGELSKFAEGSSNPSWEAKLGNLLLDHEIDSVVLSIPATIQTSSYHPFGDGQSNAKLGFGSDWKNSEFPVVGVQ